MAFYPLKAMVRCSFCGHNMVVGPSTGSKGKRYLNYRCDNKLCDRKKKSIRAKEIFNWIYDFLKDGLGLTEKDYKSYYSNLTRITDNSRQKIGIEIHSKQGRLKVINQEIKERSLELGKSSSLATVRKVNEDRVIELEQEKTELNGK
ncbi:zinc ribbon domain-containing protein, partial [Mycobacterium tuberculosis]|uniref:zinc ribbon domain-containing protein n=1 Tax=Mycobacterium tuberculosis TaxID=1773 RepID=UPI0018FFE3F4